MKQIKCPGCGRLFKSLGGLVNHTDNAGSKNKNIKTCRDAVLSRFEVVDSY